MLSQRFDSVDALRGFAMVWMTAFHFCFDLNHFGYIHQNFFSDPFWTWQRTAILSLFLFTAGLGQAIAVHQGQNWPRFWQRWAKVALCALMVSAGSYLMFPQTWIYFGVLHGMAIMLILVRLTAGWGRWLWVAGAVVVAIGFVAQYGLYTWANADFLNSRAINWLGLITHKPRTEDYVPLLPWLGVMWWGMAAGQWLVARRSAWLSTPLASGNGVVGGLRRGLALLGRWSLGYYMLHQPVLMGVLMAWAWLVK